MAHGGSDLEEEAMWGSYAVLEPPHPPSHRPGARWSALPCALVGAGAAEEDDDDAAYTVTRNLDSNGHCSKSSGRSNGT